MQAAITGMGLVLPTGLGLQPLWEHWSSQTPALSAHRGENHAGKRLPWFGAVSAAHHALSRDSVPHKLRRYGTPTTHMGVFAATQALREAGIAAVDPDNERWFVYTAQGDFTLPSYPSFERALQPQTGVAAQDFDLHRFTEEVVQRRGMDPFVAVKGLANNLLALLSLTHRFRGEGDAFVQDESAPFAALDAALFALRSGRADLVLVAGTGCHDEVWTLAEMAGQGLLSPGTHAPLPLRAFDRRHDGTVPAEGAVALVLETAEHARRRGAQALAWLGGVGCHVGASGAAPDEHAYARASQRALRQAAAPQRRVDAVLAEGKGTPLHDAAEARALHRLGQALGGEPAPLSTVRPITGLVPAGALMDVALAVAALRHGRLPPVAGLDDPEDPALPWVRGGASALPLRRVLACHHGLGGFAGAVVVDHADTHG